MRPHDVLIGYGACADFNEAGRTARALAGGQISGRTNIRAHETTCSCAGASGRGAHSNVLSCVVAWPRGGVDPS
jgi:hypothetical protein